MHHDQLHCQIYHIRCIDAISVNRPTINRAKHSGILNTYRVEYVDIGADPLMSDDKVDTLICYFLCNMHNITEDASTYLQFKDQQKNG